MVAFLLCVGRDYEFKVKLDDDDYEWAASRGNWFVTHGATEKYGYAVRSENKRLLFLHKEVLRRSFKLPETEFHTIGDHKNGDRLDNTRDNLRWATPGMNARNRFGFFHHQYELSLGR